MRLNFSMIRWWQFLCLGLVLLAISFWYFVFGIIQGIDLGIEVGWPYDRYLAICGATAVGGLGFIAAAIWKRLKQHKRASNP